MIITPKHIYITSVLYGYIESQLDRISLAIWKHL